MNIVTTTPNLGPRRGLDLVRPTWRHSGQPDRLSIGWRLTLGLERKSAAPSHPSQPQGYSWMAGPVGGICWSVALRLALGIWARAQEPDLTRRLAKPLPDPLITVQETKVTTSEQWRQVRRLELLEWFSREKYGQVPACPARLAFADNHLKSHP
jgi:hypothetical protein